MTGRRRSCLKVYNLDRKCTIVRGKYTIICVKYTILYSKEYGPQGLRFLNEKLKRIVSQSYDRIPSAMIVYFTCDPEVVLKTCLPDMEGSNVECSNGISLHCAYLLTFSNET